MCKCLQVSSFYLNLISKNVGVMLIYLPNIASLVDSVINVSGLSVSSKEMLLLAERSRVLSAKVSCDTRTTHNIGLICENLFNSLFRFSYQVLDILIRLVCSVVLQQPSTEGVNSYCFLDTKFGAAIVRN